jgi:hypothetical protein
MLSAQLFLSEEVAGQIERIMPRYVRHPEFGQPDRKDIYREA